MIKHILVPTDGSDGAARGVRYAARVAKQHGAMVHGFHVVDVKLLEGPFLRDISASLGTAPYANHQGNIALVLEERGTAALSFVERVCEEEDVPCDTERVTGLVVRTILEKSELANLIILGREGEHGEWLEELVGSTTQAVVRRASRPVLVTATDTPGRNRFLVAYDGSNYARAGLQAAAGISAEWEVPLHVLSVGGARAGELLNEARSYLDPYAIAIEYIRREGDPSETIVEYAAESAADLLIMGAYGHTKVRELVVGSTTAYAMNHAPCPLLLTR